jgi:hypothetical protein
MSDLFSIKHSFNAGDLIIILPGLQKLYEDTGKKTIVYQRLNLPAFYFDGAVHPTKHNDVPVCMNQDMFDRMKPLIEAQPYIESFQVWEGQPVDYDIDLTRDSKWIPMPAGLIHHWAWALFPEMSCDLSKQWLHRQDFKPRWVEDKIIVNRTERYTNPYITYFFLKEHQDKIVFAGTEHEHKLFCEQWKLNIDLLNTTDFLAISQYVRSCKFFMGGQSFLWHLADAQKVPRILELTPQFPNTFPTGANGYAFYHQKNLEYFFAKLNQ